MRRAITASGLAAFAALVYVNNELRALAVGLAGRRIDLIGPVMRSASQQ